MKTKLEAALETFTLLYNKKILPKLKRKDKLNSEINQLNSERNKLNSEINKFNSERNNLYSERNNLNSEINKLNSEINKLNSERNKLDSERNNLYSERNKLNSERNKLNSEINKLDSEINKLYLEINKLDSEINKLDSERNKFNSKILMDFYRFGKENDCVVVWDTYDFKLSEIKLKSYNQDKTGFLQIDSKGKIIERLFEDWWGKFKVTYDYVWLYVIVYYSPLE